MLIFSGNNNIDKYQSSPYKLNTWTIYILIIISLWRVSVILSTIIRCRIQLHEGKLCYNRGLPCTVYLLNILNITPNNGIIKTRNVQQNLQLKSKVLHRWS